MDIFIVLVFNHYLKDRGHSLLVMSFFTKNDKAQIQTLRAVELMKYKIVNIILHRKRFISIPSIENIFRTLILLFKINDYPCSA